MLKQLVEAILPGASRLEAQLGEAEADLQTKQLALNTLLIEAGADAPACTKAADAFDAAERRVKHLRGALAAARTKEAAQQVAAEQDAQRAKWAAAINLAEQRHAAIERLTKSMAAFATGYNEVLKMTEVLRAALPANHDAYAALTNGELETAMRKQLVKLDVEFAFSWPYGKVSLPDLVPTSEGALSVIRAMVPKDLQ